MPDASGQVCLTFNGEIYNFGELRAELERDGFTFQSRSDTEVLLCSYLAWGSDCLRRLEGMFAFAIFDGRTSHSRQGKVLLGRDRVGEKPLYYCAADRALAFASELKPFLRNPAFSRRVDERALNAYLADGWVPENQCILAGFEKLSPGHAGWFDLASAELRIWRYWAPPRPEPVPGRTPAELEAELEARLETAVRRQLVADVPVGVLLSGGTDSSLVTAIAARVSARPVQTFCVGFPGAGAKNEAPFARRVADYFGTDHHELSAPDASLDLLPELAEQFDEPLADTSLIPTFIVSKLTRQHVTVALGGDGCDELFGGYLHYSHHVQTRTWVEVLPRPLRSALTAAVACAPLGMRGRNFLLTTLPGVPQAISQAPLFDLTHRKRMYAAGMLQRLGAGIGEPEARKLARWDAALPRLEALTRMDFSNYLPDDVLVKTDRASMANSLELRAPWLDVPLLEFAFRHVPASLKATAQERKILPRRLAARLLPPELDWRRKQGFSPPMAAWLQPLLRDGPAPLPALERIFQRRWWPRLVRGQRGGYSNSSRIFALLMLDCWAQAYRVDF